MADKPYSQACENNKRPILTVLKTVFPEPVKVWEIGSGTGQHACFFAEALPHLHWQPTDLLENHAGINAWLAEANLPNLHPPLILDVSNPYWPCENLDAVFTANTLHIMSWEQVEKLFEHLKSRLDPMAIVCIYGPFNYNGSYTSDSNAAFDQWLKNRDVLSGIRDIEAVLALAKGSQLDLLADYSMPANNRLLVLQRIAKPQ